MYFGDFAVRYFLWHYTRALSDIARIGLNSIWFFWRFFSVGELVATLFSPFQRLDDDKPHRRIPSEILSSAIVSLLMRIVGMVFRLPLILLGLVSSAAAFLLLIAVYPLWFILPLLSPLFIIFGVGRLVGFI